MRRGWKALDSRYVIESNASNIVAIAVTENARVADFRSGYRLTR